MVDRELINHLSELFAKVITQTMPDESTAEGVTLAQLQVLKYIETHGECTVCHLAEGLGISQPAATTLVDRMAKRALVERTSGTDDRRQRQVHLTERARALLFAAETERMEKLGKILTHMDKSASQRLISSLEEFVAAAIAAEMLPRDLCLQCGSAHRADCVVNRAKA